MRPQHLNLDCELFDEFRQNFDMALDALMRTLCNKDMSDGTLTASVKISMQKMVTDNGELQRMPEIEPTVKIKVGSKADIKCDKQNGFLLKDNGSGGFVIGTNQVSMDELLQEGA